MIITLVQKQLIQLLTKYIKDETSIIGIMLTIKEEEKQELMIDYIIDNKDNINKEMILKKMLEIL